MLQAKPLITVLRLQQAETGHPTPDVLQIFVAVLQKHTHLDPLLTFMHKSFQAESSSGGIEFYSSYISIQYKQMSYFNHC